MQPVHFCAWSLLRWLEDLKWLMSWSFVSRMRLSLKARVLETCRCNVGYLNCKAAASHTMRNQHKTCDKAPNAALSPTWSFLAYSSHATARLLIPNRLKLNACCMHWKGQGLSMSRSPRATHLQISCCLSQSSILLVAHCEPSSGRSFHWCKRCTSVRGWECEDESKFLEKGQNRAVGPENS